MKIELDSKLVFKGYRDNKLIMSNISIIHCNNLKRSNFYDILKNEIYKRYYRDFSGENGAYLINLLQN
jgi:hypothetical protein